MASVENTASPPCCADRTASLRGTVEHGRQRPWPLASRPEQTPLHRAFQCPLQIARPPVLDRSGLAQLLEPPYTDPYVRWCGRGGAARLPPIPIFDPKQPVVAGENISRPRSKADDQVSVIGRKRPAGFGGRLPSWLMAYGHENS